MSLGTMGSVLVQCHGGPCDLCFECALKLAHLSYPPCVSI